MAEPVDVPSELLEFTLEENNCAVKLDSVACVADGPDVVSNETVGAEAIFVPERKQKEVVVTDPLASVPDCTERPFGNDSGQVVVFDMGDGGREEHLGWLVSDVSGVLTASPDALEPRSTSIDWLIGTVRRSGGDLFWVQPPCGGGG